MTSPSVIRAGFMAALAPLGADDHLPQPFRLTEYVPDNVASLPVIFFYPQSISYDLSMGRGSDEWTWIVQALVSANLDESSQVLLESLVGANGVKDLLQADRTLGGAVESLRVTGYEGFHLVETNQGAVLAAQWTVDLIASGR